MRRPLFAHTSATTPIGSIDFRSGQRNLLQRTAWLSWLVSVANACGVLSHLLPDRFPSPYWLVLVSLLTSCGVLFSGARWFLRPSELDRRDRAINGLLIATAMMVSTVTTMPPLALLWLNAFGPYWFCPLRLLGISF